MLIDTHAHPHMEDCGIPPEQFATYAREASVAQIVCVGTNADDSQRALEFAHMYDYVASVGLHPHEASQFQEDFSHIASLASHQLVVAIGECGLDYHYENSPRQEQLEALHAQINLSKRVELPLIFHVRGGFGDFLDVFDQHQSITGVVHSFTGDVATMRACLQRGLYIGLNGIMTFSKDPEHYRVLKEVPLESLVLETDAPFLTPHPYRGKINHSAHVRTVAEFLNEKRGESVQDIAHATTDNARRLFRL
ncbi:hypothetical protein BRC20_00740 [Candidatus Saccharibacteria bacterium QS_8_54_8]|nr:MAG: hypothetical protein BRC20_00740 [Candidatus Saccharibacteria bacterium QS_8_54_8]